GAHGFSVDVHRAGTAGSDTAPEFRSRKSDLFPQHPEQGSVVFDIKPMRGPVDLDGDHDVAPRACIPSRPAGAEPDLLLNNSKVALAGSAGQLEADKAEIDADG